MTATNEIVESRLGCVPYVIGGTLALLGPLMFGIVGFASLDEVPRPSERAVTGQLTCASTVDVPFADGACVADVRVSAVKGSGRRKRYIELIETRVGPQTLVLTSADGRHEFVLPARTRGRETIWRGCKARHENRSDVSDLPVAREAERGHSTYSISVWPLHRDRTVTVDLDATGNPTELWCGPAEVFAEKVEDYNGTVRKMFGALAGGSLLLGMLVMLGARSLGRRQAESMPNATAPAEEFVTWIAQRRAGEARVTYAGRQVVARSLYRRHRSGSLVLEIPTTVTHDMGLIRRSGTLGDLGRAIDAAGGLTASEGAPHGFPELEIIDPDRMTTWASNDRVRGKLNQLLSTPAEADIVSLIFRGGVLRFTLREPRRDLISTETTREWLDTLTEIVSAAENAA